MIFKKGGALFSRNISSTIYKNHSSVGTFSSLVVSHDDGTGDHGRPSDVGHGVFVGQVHRARSLHQDLWAVFVVDGSLAPLEGGLCHGAVPHHVRISLPLEPVHLLSHVHPVHVAHVHPAIGHLVHVHHVKVGPSHVHVVHLHPAIVDPVHVVHPGIVHPVHVHVVHVHHVHVVHVHHVHVVHVHLVHVHVVHVHVHVVHVHVVHLISMLHPTVHHLPLAVLHVHHVQVGPAHVHIVHHVQVGPAHVLIVHVHVVHAEGVVPVVHHSVIGRVVGHDRVGESRIALGLSPQPVDGGGGWVVGCSSVKAIVLWYDGVVPIWGQVLPYDS